MPKINKKKIVSIISHLIVLISTIYLIYNILLLKNIENFLRIVIIIVLILIFLTFIFLNIKNNHKNKFLTILKISSLIYSLILIFVSYNINRIYSSLSNITNNYTVKSFSIVTLNSHEKDNINDSKIGILENENNSKEIIIHQKINEENVILMDNYIDLINSLYEGQTDYIILPTNYPILFKNIASFSNLKDDTKIVYTKTSEIKNNFNNKQKIDEPFTILLMGVDSENENIETSSFNGDALMLLTFNPKNLSTTILSIPRDTYVPISCFKDNRKNKITHAAWYGEDCMITTIENFLDIKIDYYIKVNFKGVVKAVDALGGIYTYVPLSFCEQDSNRDFNNLVCLNEGYQTLNGEEVLALARHRKTINDLKRGENQQYIVRGLIDKLKNIHIDSIYNLLDTISNNIETNMSINEILSLYNVAKEIFKNNTNIDLQKLYISGYDAYIYDYNYLNNQGTKMTLYDYIPYTNSIKDVSNAMKMNLGLLKKEEVKTFTFSVDEPYIEEVIGKGEFSKSDTFILPNFVGDNEEVAVNYAKNHDIIIHIDYVTASNKYKIGEIIDQDVLEGTDLDYISEITIKVVDKIEVKNEKVNCSKEENKNNNICVVPNFVGKDYSEFNTWLKNNNYSFRTNIIEIKSSDKNYDKNKKGIIIHQEPKDINIFDLIGKKIDITYISYK